jgi:hypothetical protein
MRSLTTAIGFLLAVVGLAVDVQAQGTTPVEYEWTRRLTANGFAGVASVPSDGARFTGGGAVGWGIARRWLIEGSAAWFDLPPGANAYGANLTAVVSLSMQRPALPFVRFGVGMYAASYDATKTEPPDFYARRMTNVGPTSERKSFRDPSVILGGGVHVLVARNWALRPEVEVTVALDGGHAYTVVSGLLRVAYSFERRPITPARTHR